MALFAPVARASEHNNLVEFRAGRLNLRAGNMVHPDKRKGLIYVYQSEDGLMHFCWKDRSSGKLEEDLIIFPDDASFTRVTQCTTGRVYLLKIKPNRKFFFWVQEPKTDKDEEFCQKVNDLLNHPPSQGSSQAGSRSGGGASADGNALAESLAGWGGGPLDGDVLQNALGNMDHNQLYQLLNLMRGSSGGGNLDPALLSGLSPVQGQGRTGSGGQSGSGTTAVASGAVTTTVPSTISGTPTVGTDGSGPPRRQVVNLAQLQNIMSGISVPSGPTTSEAAIELEDMLTADRIQSTITANPEYINRLVAHLPYDPSVEQNIDTQELLSNIRSPQFRQAVDMFGNGLQTGQLGALLKQFDIPQNAVDAANKGDIQSFAEVLQSTTQGGSPSSGESSEKTGEPIVEEPEDTLQEPPPKKDKPDDEGMDLD